MLKNKLKLVILNNFTRPSKWFSSILFLALITRVHGLFYGLPLLYSVMDEHGHYIGALTLIANKTLISPYYHNIVGGYFTAPFIALTLLGMLLSGQFGSLPEMQRNLVLNPGMLLPVARLVSLFLSLINIYLIYDLCYQLFKKKRIAEIAALLLSVCLLHVQLSQFARPWTLSLVFILLVLKYSFAHRSIKNKFQTKYVLISLLASLSWGTHQSGIITFIVVFYLILRDIYRRENLKKWISPLLVIGFFLTLWQKLRSRNAYFDYPEYLNGLLRFPPDLDIFFNNVFSNFRYFFNVLAWHETVIFVLGVIGFWLLSKSKFKSLKQTSLLILVVSILTFYQTTRSMLPVLILLIVFAAYATDQILTKFAKYKSLPALVLIALVIPQLILIFRYDWLLHQKPTFTLANEWIVNEVLKNESIAYRHNGYSQLIPSPEAARPILTLNPSYYRNAYLHTNTSDYYHITYLNDLSNHGIDAQNYLTEYKPKYVVDLYFDPMSRLAFESNKSNYQIVKSFYPTSEQTKISYLVENMYDPFPWQLLFTISQPGPFVDIYRLVQSE